MHFLKVLPIRIFTKVTTFMSTTFVEDFLMGTEIVLRINGRIRDPDPGIQKKPIPAPGVQKAPDPNPQHCPIPLPIDEVNSHHF
jgi:hypothetical protein